MMGKLLCFRAGIFTAIFISSGAIAAENNQFQLKGPVKEIGIEKIYDTVTLTPDQIKTCLISADKLATLSKDLSDRRATFPAKLAKMSALNVKLEAAQTYLDKNPTKEINDDAKMAERNGQVTDYNRMVADYNEITAAYSKETGNYTANNTTYTLERVFFKETCADKHYYAEDMNAVRSQN